MTHLTQRVSTTATAEEISEIIGSLEEALIGKPISHCLMAMLSLILVAQHADITADELADGVQQISEHIAAYIESLPSSQLPSNLIN